MDYKLVKENLHALMGECIRKPVNEAKITELAAQAAIDLAESFHDLAANSNRIATALEFQNRLASQLCKRADNAK